MQIILFHAPFLDAYRRLFEIIEQAIGKGGKHLPAGSSVMVRTHAEFLSDTLMVMNKIPEVVISHLTTEDLITLSQLALGPKCLYLDGANLAKDPLLRPLFKKKGPVVRISNHITIQGLRQLILLRSLNRLYPKR